MLNAKTIILRDKQVFEKKEGSLRVVGKPMDIVHDLKEAGYELVHIIDTEALRGGSANFDTYNHLTYFMHIQVECGPYEKLIEKLLAINARVVISLPTTLDLKKFAAKKRLLVGKIPEPFEGSVEGVHDILIENATPEAVKKYQNMGKRIFVYKKDFNKKMEKLIFGVIE